MCFLTQVSGGDGFQAHHLQSSRSQHQLTAPRVEVLLPRKQTTTCQSSDVTQCSQKELKVTHTNTHLEQVGEAREDVGGDGGNVIHTLAVLQKHPDQQQHRPIRGHTVKG